MPSKPTPTPSPMAFGDELDASPRAAAKSKSIVNHGQRFDYQVRVLCEGALGTILLGRSSINPDKLTDALNQMTRTGYRNTFQVLERRRLFIFWSRESLLLTFERSIV